VIFASGAQLSDPHCRKSAQPARTPANMEADAKVKIGLNLLTSISSNSRLID
jgi:hypothetical protein